MKLVIFLLAYQMDLTELQYCSGWENPSTRTISVKIKKRYSDKSNIKCGVSKGSILGLLL